MTLQQSDESDSGLLSLMMMAHLHGIAVDHARLRHEFGQDPFNTQTLLLAAKSLGFVAKKINQPWKRLHLTPLPVIAQSVELRYFILAKIDPGNNQPLHSLSALPDSSKFLIQHPGSPPEIVTVAQLQALWNGAMIFLTSKANFAGDVACFDFTWFIPAIVKYRSLLGEVLLISLVLQVIGLVTPMFFQVVMDKVLVNHAMKTLNVIAVGLICATLFEATLSGIRTWLFAHTSSKMDVELGARLFRHLLNLPLAYFQARRVGDSVARIRELENIRSFLTGNAMTLVMDVAFSVVFFAVMFWYSTELTLLVLASIPTYFLLSVVFTPVIRQRLEQKFTRNAENQSFLVETIKALAVEPRWIHKWDQQLAAYVTASLSVTNVATIASGGVTLISKLVTAAIMWMGATLVIDQKMSVGELVAFNMLAGQVSSPILRLAQLWNDFQQVGISMSRLGDILNTMPEIAGQKSRLPRIQGMIAFDQVSFRYRPDTADILRQVTLRIAPGEVIGIVGRSGSGKSTLTKLVQRLFVPDRGRVLIDGQDVAIIDTSSLRQQIGVVLQENTLFNRSVRDNIALTDPTLSLEAIIEVAQLAGAHGFICELPEGYDTKVRPPQKE
jgi:subfamily B ATP-binding cassette protein HlyB/CyaB